MALYTSTAVKGSSSTFRLIVTLLVSEFVSSHVFVVELVEAVV